MDRLSVDRVGTLLDAVRGLRVLVIGDLMLDRYISGRVDRISPEAPVPVVRVSAESAAVGGAGNVAANVVALGARCEVVGLVGDDTYGRVLRESIEGLGVETAGLVRTAERPTTVKTRILARRQQVVRVDHEEDGDVDEALSDALKSALMELAPDCDAIVLEDYNKGVLLENVIEAALKEGSSRGIPTIVDPKRMRFFAYGGSTIFKPNAKELADALGAHLHPDDPVWMEETRQRLCCRNLLLTLGEEGMALQTEESDHLHVPTVARSVYDVSGAGDTVTAVVAVALAAGASPVEAAILANHSAALEVSKAGVATVSPEEILRHYRQFVDGKGAPE